MRSAACVLAVLLLAAPLAAADVPQTAYARSAAVLRAFQKTHPCPANGKTTGACPGWIKDHIVALCDGGADAVSNLQWQTVAAAHAKDRTECHHRPPVPTQAE
jgi:hypothetical protein